MGDLIIWKFVGGVSAINGLACFALSSTYDMLFGKLGFCGHLVYLLACLIMWCLMLGAKRIRVSQKVQGLVVALIFVVICLISMVFDKLVSGKSDVWSIISYGSFALMSVSMSRKLELGFETGISTFFLQLFAAQLFKIKWFLLPIALVFCSLVIILRHYSSESRVQSGSTTPNGYHPIEVGPPNAAVIDIIGEEDINERQDSTEMGEVSGLSPLSTNNEQNSQEETSQVVGEVSEENVSDGGNELNSEQEEDGTWSSLGAESSYSWEQDRVSSANYQNGWWMHNSPTPQLLRRRRMRRMIPAIQNISSSLGDTLRWWAPTTPLFFFKKYSGGGGPIRFLSDFDL